jgi:GMP synthase (glutamine-hydrolysing)
MLPVCLYVIGEPPDELRSAFGDYTRWFGELAAETGAELTPVDGMTPTAEIGRPAWLRQWSAIVLTGSPSSVVGAPPWPEPWVERAAQLIRDAPAAGVPVLGVCYGHQLIAAAHGGQVRQSPGGWQGSTVAIEVNQAGRADLLFDGVAPRFGAQECHADEVVAGSGIEVLATGPVSVEALRAGDAVRGVQFHPEFSLAVTRAYVELNVAAGAPQPAPAVDTPSARRVFANFIRHFAERA